MSLSVNHRPGATYLLPSTTPSTPGLTPNTSSMSSSYSLSSSPSLSPCPSGQADSVDLGDTDIEDAERESAELSSGGNGQNKASSERGRTVMRASSRPSLRHMPSWRSFVSHASHGTHKTVSHRGSAHEMRQLGSAQSDEPDECERVRVGAYDDADELDLDLDGDYEVDTPGPQRGRDRFIAGSNDKRSTRKAAAAPGAGAGPASASSAGRGSSGFAKALKRLSLGKLGTISRGQRPRPDAFDMSRQSSSDDRSQADGRHDTRVETPYHAPLPLGIVPRSHSDLSPIPVSPDSPDFDDYFTPPTIPTSMLVAHASLPSHPAFPTLRGYSYTSRRDWLAMGASVGQTPILTPSLPLVDRKLPVFPDVDGQASSASSHPSGPEADATADAEGEADTDPSPELDSKAEITSSFPFTIDIFSPRIHRAPVLRGIVDALPVSPLELPRSQSAFVRGPHAQTHTRPTASSYPARPISPSTAASPITHSPAELGTMPSLGQVASSYTHPSFHTLHFTASPARPSSLALRLPRASFPTSNTSPSIFPSPTSHLNNLPFTRRHSAIIRPPILPTPTPPSLITSPRTLGTPLIPPGPISPSRLETLVGAPPAVFPPIEPALNRRPSSRIRRASAAVRGGAISPTSGLGLGSMSGAGSGFRRKGEAKGEEEIGGGATTGAVVAGEDYDEETAKRRLPTPGTFGLEGEAEKRLMSEGLNPYFA